jgi:acetyltransferase-like isoleucine patch superfamily enzyme
MFNNLYLFLQKIYQLVQSLRVVFWRLLGAKIGKNVRLGSGVLISNPKNCIIGDNVIIARFCRIEAGQEKITISNGCRINQNCWIGGNEKITLEENVFVGPNCNIISTQYNYKEKDREIGSQGDNSSPIYIGRNCWIASNCTIVKGTIMGRGSVLGANSLACKKYEDFCIFGGVPARLIKSRFS